MLDAYMLPDMRRRARAHESLAELPEDRVTGKKDGMTGERTYRRTRMQVSGEQRVLPSAHANLHGICLAKKVAIVPRLFPRACRGFPRGGGARIEVRRRCRPHGHRLA